MRNTYPSLYKSYLAYAFLSIALGLNFLFLTPTFMPLSIPKEFIGPVFLGCGITKLTLLLPTKTDSLWLRRSMGLSVVIYSFWASILTFEFFRLHQTSMQLPLTYIGLAVLGVLLLIEPFYNAIIDKVEE